MFGNPTVGMSRARARLGRRQLQAAPDADASRRSAFTSTSTIWSRAARSPSPPLARGADAGRRRAQLRRAGAAAPGAVKGFFGWITYSLIRSERRDHPGSDWRLFDYDQTHVLAVLASYELGHGLEVGARFRYTTGLPRTPGGRRVLRRARRTTTSRCSARRTSIRHPGLLSAGRAAREELVPAADEAGRVPRRAERDQPKEPGGDHLQLRLHAARRHITGLPTLAVLGARLEF